MRSIGHDAGGVGAASMLDPALDLVVICSVVIRRAGMNSCEGAWHLVEVRLVLFGVFVNALKIEVLNSAWSLDPIVNRSNSRNTTATNNKH